ncbi:hypothetical protein X928_04815 [Petrotoga miotherma DSM 10691]|jgi:hypothetical protein|uniref:Uncharacterized protein n=1 Tax=Petrotoga miotherma DSM 10691 TaxID=1434326 RepID=A0A2K1PCS5_9BACT|nr:hypothetical protein [Petrotoga miotherma]PNS00592.1 hypothetical protein X928_04815 [Petrotoga miotherma DSM 10691]
MEKMVLRIFQKEIERQCKFAIIAIGQVKTIIAIEQVKTGSSNNNSDIVWYAIQNFLVAVGNISKIFWPTRNKERGEELRRSLGIEDNSPIQPRNFRNHFEHFDERLEEWAESSERLILADSNIGPSNMITGIDPKDYLRNFDPTSWTLTFRGDKYELKPIIKAICELYPKVSTEASKPWWE